ncbi:MAG: hypothetical protein KBD37_03560 [Burkholderiales bacterium]|nr:hypothetical protein [Burkholderiales bacterium]
MMDNSKAKQMELLQFFNNVIDSNLPSKHRFFNNLANAPGNSIRNPQFLGEVYLAYQAAMHATRVMVYFLPFLNCPSLRKRKLAIYMDDDGLANGDTHHYQLSRAFKNIGADITIEDNEFGDLDILQQIVTPVISKFIGSVKTLYPQSLGAWCIVEMLSEDWMQALCNSLGANVPQIKNEPYFHDCFIYSVEKKHGQEALQLTIELLLQKPQLEILTLNHAKEMACCTKLIWDGLDNILTKYLA